MNEQEEISLIRQELKLLQSQLQEQQQRIASLHNRLSQLSGAEPSFTSGIKPSWSLENFIGMRLIHLIGIIVLVTGISIGVKYAIDRNLISELMRIALAYGAGIILYLLSVRLKSQYALFSAILLSGGMASLYFTTYAAFVYYQMIPFVLTFLIMISLTIFTVYQAIVYNRQEVALLGLIGAYAIPFLISRNTERADLFFLYITIINIGVVYLCARKPWTIVGRIAQTITWVLFIGWAATAFEPKQRMTGLLFMTCFFLLFLMNALSYKIFQKKVLALTNIYQLLLNSLALYLGALFVFGSSFANADLAMITIAVSVIVALQAAGLHYLLGEEYAKKILAALAFILFIVFIAFQWEGLIVTFLWLLIAIVVFGFGVFKRWPSLRMASIILMGATLLKLVAFDSLTFSTVQKVISYIALGILLLVVSYLYQKYRQRLFHDD